MAYDKMNEYIDTIFQVYMMVVKMTPGKNNTKLKCISLVIYNYLIKLAKDNEFDLSKLESAPNSENLHINLVPFSFLLIIDVGKYLYQLTLNQIQDQL